MSDKNQTVIIIIIAVLAIFLVNKLFKGVNKLGKGVGDKLDDFGITTGDEKAGLKKLKAFQPSYYKSLKGDVKLLTHSAALKLAEKIYDARTLKVYYDDAVMLGVIKQLSTQSQISFLSDEFVKKYGEDMLNFFYPYLENRNAIELFNYVSTLPIK